MVFCSLGGGGGGGGGGEDQFVRGWVIIEGRGEGEGMMSECL